MPIDDKYESLRLKFGFEFIPEFGNVYAKNFSDSEKYKYLLNKLKENGRGSNTFEKARNLKFLFEAILISRKCL